MWSELKCGIPHDMRMCLTHVVRAPNTAERRRVGSEITARDAELAELRAAPALEAAARDAAAPLAAALAARDAELAALVVDAWVISAVLIVT